MIFGIFQVLMGLNRSGGCLTNSINFYKKKKKIKNIIKN